VHAKLACAGCQFIHCTPSWVQVSALNYETNRQMAKQSAEIACASRLFLVERKFTFPQHRGISPLLELADQQQAPFLPAAKV
jgi:hypothetical protein